MGMKVYWIGWCTLYREVYWIGCWYTLYNIHGGIFDWLLVYTIHGSILDWGGAGLILHFVSHIQCISETNQFIYDYVYNIHDNSSNCDVNEDM